MSATIGHEVMADYAGKSTCLLGNHAIVRGALEAGVQFFSCYPGTPSSEVGDTFYQIHQQADVLFEYSVNEKIAVEIAFAASLTGARSMCSMKHLGLNYAGDPLATMPYVGIKGGMIIVSAGDPSALTSPNEQDQRHFNKFLYYPVFDPSTPEDAYHMTKYAFKFSEKTGLPVIMRPTTRVCHTSGMVKTGPLAEIRNEIEFVKDPPRYVPVPPNARRMRTELIDRVKHAEQLLSESPFFSRTGDGKYGVIASGVAYAYTHQVLTDLDLFDNVSLLQIGAYPIPETILSEFLNSVESALIVEELTPFVEEWVTLSAFRNQRIIPIYGKHTSHLPLAFEYNPDLVEDAIREYLHMESRSAKSSSDLSLPPRPPVLCAGCPHRTSFYYARKVFGKNTVYCNDIGCYTLGYGEPLDSCDTLLCMGSSISQASGIARSTGKRTVAYIGDSTFFHSGLPALVNALQQNDQITICILNNYVTAMTGFQPSVACGSNPPTSANDDMDMGQTIELAVRGLGVKEVYTVDQFDEDKAIATFEQAKASKGLNVVICNSPCVIHEAKISTDDKRAPYTIDQEKCNECSLCVRMLGCPAIFVEDDKYYIDHTLCDGCDLCAKLCNKDAISQEASNVR